MPEPVVVSIITPTLNQLAYIAATLQSVRAQTYRHIEHVVIDGGSTDGSLEVVRRFADGDGVAWVSEPDRGLYDAVNKGIDRTSGEILGYLNSDDAYFPWAIEAIVDAFARHPEADLVYADGIKVDEEIRQQRLRLFPPFDGPSLASYESLMQPAVFWRRRLVDRIGGFDATRRYTADLDYWLRAAESGATIIHLDEVIAIERLHGARLSTAQAGAMAVEDAAMRAQHAGAGNGPKARRRAAARHRRWQRWLWLRMLVASRLRRPTGPWPRFVREGDVRVSTRRVLVALLPGRQNRARKAARSRLAAEILKWYPERPAGDAPRPHGHALVTRFLPAIAPGRRGHVLEVGSTREELPGQGSTTILAGLAASLGLPFVTVDMDPANTERARAALDGMDHAEAVNARGEAYLETFDQPVVAAYLDAFDIEHGHHSADRVERYQRYLSTDITNEAAASMHLACAAALLPRMVPGGLIVVDDTWRDGAGFAGKGATAVPWLLERGYRIIGTQSSAVALQAPLGNGRIDA